MKTINIRNEPVMTGVVALLILLLGPKLGYTLPTEATVALQGLALTMAGVVLRSNVKGPVTVAREGKE